VSQTTAGGLLTTRPVRAGSRVALVAPASPFARDEFDRGVAELRRLGLDPVWDDRVFARDGFVAGTPEIRAAAINDALADRTIDALVVVRGGYGSAQILPRLDARLWRSARTALVGYSDATSLLSWLNRTAGLVSFHGPMLVGRLAVGPSAYDPLSFLRAVAGEPVGELRSNDIAVLSGMNEVSGVLAGGTLTQLTASFGTPYAFDPPVGHVLFLDEIAERPYRLDRMLTQLRFAGIFAKASAVVFNGLPECDEPGGTPSARDTVRAALQGFPGPVLFGLKSGHGPGPTVTLPLGAHCRVITGDRPGLVIDEAAAGD
jgi:muramoyltetrapeptide carboxypeptidase